jgi:hypothetical protein
MNNAAGSLHAKRLPRQRLRSNGVAFTYGSVQVVGKLDRPVTPITSQSRDPDGIGLPGVIRHRSPARPAALLIVVSSLEEIDCLIGDLVDQPVFLSDAPRPTTS